VIVRTYWAWETTATLRLFGGALGAGAPTGGGEGGDKSCRHAHSLYISGVMVHFRYYKNEVVLGWPGAAHALIGVNWFESVFHATTDFCKIHTDRSRFGNGGRKTVFRSSFGARPCQCMGMTVNNYMMSHKKRSCRTSSSLSLYRLT